MATWTETVREYQANDPFRERDAARAAVRDGDLPLCEREFRKWRRAAGTNRAEVVKCLQAGDEVMASVWATHYREAIRRSWWWRQACRENRVNVEAVRCEALGRFLFTDEISTPRVQIAAE